ncbi:MAG: amidohydrolase family protein [Acidobacteria bacterium]|nr:amidohydrolase family protein [Acidobacteriota bacterium]
MCHINTSIKNHAGVFVFALIGMLQMSLTGVLMAQEPDLILFNGKIATVDENMTFVRAMAIKDEAIVAAGKTDEEILKLAGTNTKKLDLKGRTVIPGIIDPHNHATDFRAEDFPEAKGVRVPPSGIRDEVKKGILDALRKRRQEVKPGQWIIINPMGEAGREVLLFEEITRADLDRLAPSNPVMINEAGTGAPSQIMFNSKAIELIEKEFPPFTKFPNTHIKIDGTNLSSLVVKDIILKRRDKEYAESWRKLIISTLATQGITTVGTRIPRTPLNALVLVDRKGEMPIRFAWFFSDGSYYNPEGFYKRFPNLAGAGSRYLWNLGQGEELTESPTTGPCTTLPLRNKELKERDEKAGIDLCFLNNPLIRATIKDQIAYGRGVEYHAAGDKTADLLLEIIEEVQRETGMTDEDIREKRLTFEHLALVRPDHLPKLKKYGIIMSNAPNYFVRNLDASKAANVPQNFGEQYLKWHQPAKSFLDNGITTVIGEIAYGNVFDNLRMYITRRVCFTPTLPEQGKVGVEKCAVQAPEQAVDRISALRMATIWPAFYVLKEKELGSLEVGKWADLLVLDRDYFQVPADEIGQIKVLATILGGKVVYASPDFGPINRTLFKSPDYFGKAVLTD